jgi:hypothetical protein
LRKDKIMSTGKEVANDGRGYMDALIGLLVLGSVWGALEVLLGGAMKAGGIPYRGDLLTGLGMMLMAVAVAMYRRPLMLIGIAAVAIGVRQLSVPIFHLSTFCKANSCLAVFLGGAALAGAVVVAGKRLRRGILPRVVTGFSAGLAAGVSFYYIGMRVAPCRYLLSFNRPGGLVAFMQAEGLIWAGLCAVLFPVGYKVGESLGESVFELHFTRPALYYTATFVLVALCWTISAIAIAHGL